MTTYKHHQAGFTMAELLIAVAIIVVLVAIALPLFTTQLDAAEASVCEANRRSMFAEVRSTSMVTKQTEQAVFDELIASGSNDYTCPKHGTWSFNAETSTITCSVHTEGGNSGNSGNNGGGGTEGDYSGFKGDTVAKTDLEQLFAFALAHSTKEAGKDCRVKLNQELLKEKFGESSMFKNGYVDSYAVVDNGSTEAVGVLFKTKEEVNGKDQDAWYAYVGSTAYKMTEDQYKQLENNLKNSTNALETMQGLTSSWEPVT